jgi:hypothetical protein
VASKSKRAGELLKQTDFSQPTRMQSSTFPEPEVAPPPAPPSSTLQKRGATKPKGVDRFELEKHKFKVDLFDLLRMRIPTGMEGEITRGDKASFYLIFDKCFQMLATGKFHDWGLGPIDGKLQAMYFWFYWESYGKGYSACALGHGQLQKLLSWSRNTVKDVLSVLQEYSKPVLGHGLVQAIEEYPPFEYTRPQVYRVYLPREILAKRWRQLVEETNRQAGSEEIKKILAMLEGHLETQEIPDSPEFMRNSSPSS